MRISCPYNPPGRLPHQRQRDPLRHQPPRVHARRPQDPLPAPAPGGTGRAGRARAL